MSYEPQTTASAPSPLSQTGQRPLKTRTRPRNGSSSADIAVTPLPEHNRPVPDHMERQGKVPRSTRRVLPRTTAFWAAAATTAALLAASSAPTPLYPVFQAEFGFSPTTLTVIFAVYVFALLASLLTVGRLSDHVGRLPVLGAALILNAAAMAVFLGADGATWLVAARIVQGFATGAGVSVLSAYLLDLKPGAGSRTGPLVAGVAPTLGLGLGTAITGLLVQYAPQPTHLVFAVLAALFLALALATAVLPETVRPVPGALSSLRPRVGVPPRARRAFARAVPTMVSTWALGGLILSVGGALLDSAFGQSNHAVVGAVLGVFAASGAVAAVVTNKLSPASVTRIGITALVLGTALYIVALATASLAVFIIASVLAGSGFGPAFLGVLRSVSQFAEAHERAALLSAVYVVSYLAFSIPALLAGLAIPTFGLRITSLAYGALVLVIALGALIFGEASARLSRRVPG